jgi:hypothetical protein
LFNDICGSIEDGRKLFKLINLLHREDVNYKISTYLNNTLYSSNVVANHLHSVGVKFVNL